MIVNQRNEPVFTEPLWYVQDLSDEDAKEVLLQLLSHLGLQAVRTNGTKSGASEIRLVVEDERAALGAARARDRD